MERLKNVFCQGIIPVVCPADKNETDIIIEALLLTDIRCLEITLRNSYAFDAIHYIKDKYPQFTVGAGTVNSVEIFKDALKTGADFFVSPGYFDELLAEVKKANVPFLPGVSTPAEILKLSSMGYKILKLFPAECSGGTKVLSLYKGAFQGISFVPTGGITVDNVSEYLKLENVVACGGSFMLPKEMIKNKDIKGISEIITRCERGSNR